MTVKRSSLLLLLISLILALVLSSSLVFGAAPTADFGDAPDGTNTTAEKMSAYAGVSANFPTAVNGGGPPGPRHDNSTKIFYLGAGVSAEENADFGMDEDLDGINNIKPGLDLSNRDGLDDGIKLPPSFEHCQTVTLEYEVTLLNSYGGPIYANLWADWNRDGDWEDASPGACEGPAAKEWVLQNQLLAANAPGTHTLKVTFTPYFPNPGQDLWLRLSVSEGQANSDGSAPPGGYQLGETEDYHLPGVVYASALPVIAGADQGPAPIDPGAGLDGPYSSEEPLIVADWMQIPDGPDTTSAANNGVRLRLRNFHDQPIPVEIDVMVIGGGAKEKHNFDPVRVPGNGALVVEDALGWAQTMGKDWTSPATFFGEFSYKAPDDVGPADMLRDELLSGEVPQAYMHKDTTTGDKVILYGEEAYYRQVQDLSFDNNPDLGRRLQAAMPPGPIPPGLAQITAYHADDPIVNESPPEDNPDDMHPQSPGRSDASIVCLEWFTAPVDNGKGEDTGLNDDGWLARGAKVEIYRDGVLEYDTYLNSLGCTSDITVTPGSTLYIRFLGRARLEVQGQGYNHLHRMRTDLIYYEVDGFVTNAQPGQTYRPEFFGNDAFSMISYAAQERFNGGSAGFDLILIKDYCGGVSSSGEACFDWDFQGQEAIFVSYERWRKKFQVGLVFGQAMLWQEADYNFNCSYLGSGWTLESLEYDTCAAIKGWGSFVAGDIWNNINEFNPQGVYVTPSGNVYSLDEPYSKCHDVFGGASSNCLSYGYAKDWMRQWWDYHTNNNPAEPGTGPTHAQLFNLIDDISWSGSGPMNLSVEIRDVLPEPQQWRWELFSCTNGVDIPVLSPPKACP